MRHLLAVGTADRAIALIDPDFNRIRPSTHDLDGAKLTTVSGTTTQFTWDGAGGNLLQQNARWRGTVLKAEALLIIEGNISVLSICPMLHEVNYEVAHHSLTRLVFIIDRSYITCGRAGSSPFPQHDRCGVG